eukprot:58503-Chlamydomonas_euryale.AAC.1
MALPTNLVMRDLEEGDFHKGYLELLSQLTTVGSVTEEQFCGAPPACILSNKPSQHARRPSTCTCDLNTCSLLTNCVARLAEMKAVSQGYKVLVIEELARVAAATSAKYLPRIMVAESCGCVLSTCTTDIKERRIVGSATSAVEKKFIHACSQVGHIEDVVVDSNYRGQRLGQRLIEALTKASSHMGCYKVILDCAEENVPFYEKCGLKRKEIQMEEDQLGYACVPQQALEDEPGFRALSQRKCHAEPLCNAKPTQAQPAGQGTNSRNGPFCRVRTC